MSEANLNGLIAIGAATIITVLIVFAARAAEKMRETKFPANPIPPAEEEENGC